MKRFFSSIFLFFYLFSTLLYSQEKLDSILNNRNHSIYEYKKFKEKMESRTWINMVELNSRADKLIQQDNFIIQYYLPKEIKKRKVLQDKNIVLTHEINLLNMELEHQLFLYKEIDDYQRFFLIGMISFFVLSVLLLILFIEIHLKYRSYKNTQIKSKNYKELYQKTKAENIQLKNDLQLLGNIDTSNAKAEKDLDIEQQNIYLTNELIKSKELIKKEIEKRKKVEFQILEIIKKIKGD